ncbi:hypothetical protein SERLA73DRAFT_149138 [Serpula lacrymans var. lacrymans S7.3]|uniref:Uncharacterized protein n=1 Tax=Serpula lacrymans var. lacrymans (strain S7.3) TaxID=936435 RepID=F8PFH3_SERL3|nr:hypothetical protein SERLA73DRAFT_149138 [Serpula lacrymans var. lacrymans S7.3]
MPPPSSQYLRHLHNASFALVDPDSDDKESTVHAEQIRAFVAYNGALRSDQTVLASRAPLGYHTFATCFNRNEHFKGKLAYHDEDGNLVVPGPSHHVLVVQGEKLVNDDAAKHHSINERVHRREEMEDYQDLDGEHDSPSLYLEAPRSAKRARASPSQLSRSSPSAHHPFRKDHCRPSGARPPSHPTEKRPVVTADSGTSKIHGPELPDAIDPMILDLSPDTPPSTPSTSTRVDLDDADLYPAFDEFIKAVGPNRGIAGEGETSA